MQHTFKYRRQDSVCSAIIVYFMSLNPFYTIEFYLPAQKLQQINIKSCTICVYVTFAYMTFVSETLYQIATNNYRNPVPKNEKTIVSNLNFCLIFPLIAFIIRWLLLKANMNPKLFTTWLYKWFLLYFMLCKLYSQRKTFRSSTQFFTSRD